jgi:poly(beta-D-mannuronate) C5 epimerase
MAGGRLRAGVAIGWILLASSPAAEVLVAPLVPDRPAFGPIIAEHRQRVATLIDDLAPPPERPGRIEVIRARDAAALRRSFLGTARLGGQWSSQAIRIETGGWKLGGLAEALGRPELLDCRRQLCELRAPILIEAGASLHVGADAGSATLRLSQSHGAFIASLGSLFVQEAALDGRRLEEGGPAATAGPEFRPFLVVYDNGRLTIASSRLAHMGYDAPSAYGVTLTVGDRTGTGSGRPSALIHDSEFRDLYYGFYSHAAKGVDIVGNRYVDSMRYGIDPHDGTEAMWVADNVVEGTRIAHGIIASHRVRNIIIHANRSIGNAGSGIALDRGSSAAVISGNVVVGNGGNGITLYESHEVAIDGNEIMYNAGSGIRLRQSSGISIAGNLVERNGKHGLEASSRTPEREATAEEASHARPVRLALMGNRFGGNRWSACTFKGVARLDLVPAAAGEVLAPCGEPEALAGDKEWAAAVGQVWERREPLRLEAAAGVERDP